MGKKRCLTIGCEKSGSYGHPGSQEYYCRGHKTEDMPRRAGHSFHCQSCHRVPRYGRYTKPLACAKHRTDDMTRCDRGLALCKHKGCTKTAGFGDGKLEWCADHASVEHSKSVYGRLCEKCDQYAYYGDIGSVARFCRQHASPGHVRGPRRRCEFTDCREFASFGIHRPTRCVEHKQYGVDREFLLMRCDVCREPGVLVNGTCVDCQGVGSRVRLRRQEQVRLYLKEQGLVEPLFYDQPVTKCSKMRPDFLWDCQTHYVVCEVDEFAHQSYNDECEQTRMFNLTQEWHVPTVWIRYNPDGPGPCDHERLHELHMRISERMKQPPPTWMNVEYMFYSKTDFKSRQEQV